MSEQQQILSIIDNLGGRENIKDYYHCATRLRFNLFDYDKINKDALKAPAGPLSRAGQRTVPTHYRQQGRGSIRCPMRGVPNRWWNSAPSSSGTAANRESFISRIFAFISGCFLPLIGIRRRRSAACLHHVVTEPAFSGRKQYANPAVIYR